MLLMGLTFALSSFACVGPFVGTLLAASVTEGSRMRPTVGMVVFATGLALPFFLLALFPSFLKRLPRSGGWLARVKVVMGFVIVAAALKYLSSLDQVLQWGFLTREKSPLQHLVQAREVLQGGGDDHESHHHFHARQPSAAARQALEERGKQSQQEERQS